MDNNFKEEDAKRLQKIMARVVKEAEFKMGINEFVDFFNELDWVNKTLINKIRANIFEINKVVQPPKEDKKARTTRAKK